MSNSRTAPVGDTRLTINIREDIHQRLKILAIKRRTTVGDLLESAAEFLCLKADAEVIGQQLLDANDRLNGKKRSRK